MLMNRPLPTGQAPEISAARLFRRICILGWIALLTVTATSIFVAGLRPLSVVIAMALGLWLPYVLLTPLVFRMVRRFPIAPAAWTYPLTLHIAASLFFVLIGETWVITLGTVFAPTIVQLTERYGGKPPLLPQPNFRLAGVKAVANLPLYWVLAAISHALITSARLRERELQAAELTAHLTQARLAGLRAQLQPHFLFNTLNSIAALIPHDAKLATEMVLNLADLLRMTLRDVSTERITLREELRLLELYVAIQQLRFGPRLCFRAEVPEECLDLPVSPLLLQPLVENAIRHGVEPSDVPEEVVVRARLQQEKFCVEVFNSGRVSAGDAVSANPAGIGLTNTKARLAALYGTAQQFSFGPVAGGGFLVQIDLPLADPVGEP